MLRYFFDLPVYRVSQTQYEAELLAHIENVVFPVGTPHGDLHRRCASEDRPAYDRQLSDCRQSFGGCWQFNEIIGYVRLHFRGIQILGEYFAPERKRIVRTRTRTLTFRTWKLAPEVEIESPITNASITTAISQYVSACRRELKGRFIDARLLDQLLPQMNWLSLVYAGDAQPVVAPAVLHQASPVSAGG